jgi:hypothetical protein
MDFIILHTNFKKICVDQALGDDRLGKIMKSQF